MRVRVIEGEIDPVWIPAIAALTATMAADVDIVRGESLVAMPRDDFYLWIGRSLPDLERDLSELASREPSRCSRTIVLGLPLDFVYGQREPAPETLVRLLESHRLAGAFGPQALIGWRWRLSSFAGPKDRMRAFATNPVKAFQTTTYANWCATRGANLADFLLDYLRFIETEATRCSR
jgi:hypothetical protein